jgi:hypothetical protein
VHVQVPAAQARFAPHIVPFAAFAPVSVQVIVPVPHAVVPTWQGFAGVQVMPAVHATQAPPLQTRFVPHAMPFATSVPVSLQTGVPVAHDCEPTWQMPVDGTQVVPSVQVTHCPPLHTRFVPQVVPFVTLPVSRQVCDPVVHDVCPT